MGNTKDLIMHQLDVAKEKIRLHIHQKNIARNSIGWTNVLGAASGVTKNYLYGEEQIQQGRNESSDYLKCGIQDFQRVTEEYENTLEKYGLNPSLPIRKLLIKQRLRKYREALWCILRFQHGTKNYMQIEEARVLDHLLEHHYSINKEILDVEEDESSLKVDE